MKIFDCILAEKTDRDLVLIYQIPKQMTFAGVNFPPESRSFGYYWKDRNYNVYHWKDPKGSTIFSYFNISKDTKIHDDNVEWVDLIVDIAFHPDGRVEILDENEIPENMNHDDLSLIRRTQSEILGNMGRLFRELEERTSLIMRREETRKQQA